jgi:tight adherence protein B
MAKFTVMNEITTQIGFLALISISATILGYILYSEYARSRHILHIKKTLEAEDATEEFLLEKQQTSKETFLLKIAALMKKAGLDFSPLLFLALFVAVLMLIGSALTLFLQHWSGYIIGFLLGSFLFYSTVQSLISRRTKNFNKALATAISVLVKMMKNGIGFEQALVKSVEVSSSALFKNLFEQFFQEKNTLGEMEAFEKMYEYIASKELRIFALAIKIGRQSGGQFSNTLAKVEKTISYREKMQQKVDVVTREGSVGSYVVVAITIFLYLMLNGNFHGKIHEYFMTSPYGRFQLLGIILWVFIGIMINKLITRVNK